MKLTLVIGKFRDRDDGARGHLEIAWVGLEDHCGWVGICFCQSNDNEELEMDS